MLAPMHPPPTTTTSASRSESRKGTPFPSRTAGRTRGSPARVECRSGIRSVAGRGRRCALSPPRRHGPSRGGRRRRRGGPGGKRCSPPCTLRPPRRPRLPDLKVAREPRFLLEPLEGREALPRESNADPGFVVLPDEGAAVPCRPRGDMVLLEEDDVDVAAGQVESDARPHAPSAHHDDLGFQI